MFDSRQLEYIIAIAEEQSLTRAASRLYISQSALSQQLSNLYESGVPQLFVYRNKKMLLTDAGKIYVNAARSILRLKKRGEERIREISSGSLRTETVRIACISLEQNARKRAEFLSFRHDFPSLIPEIHLLWTRGEIAEAARSDAFDLLLIPAIPGLPAFQHADSYDLSVFETELVPVVPAKFPASSGKTVLPPILLPADDFWSSGPVRNALEMNHLRAPVYAKGCPQSAALHLLEKEHLSIFLESGEARSNPQVRIVPLEHPCRIPLHLYVRRGTSLQSRAAGKIAESILKQGGR